MTKEQENTQRREQELEKYLGSGNQQILEKHSVDNIRLTIVEKVKGLYHGQDEMKLNKATKNTKADIARSDDYQKTKGNRISYKAAGRKFSEKVKERDNESRGIQLIL